MPTSTISALNGPTGFVGDAQNKFHQPTTVRAALLALGIVYGDLGTSPLYYRRSCILWEISSRLKQRWAPYL
jgi:K+ transporter